MEVILVENPNADQVEHLASLWHRSVQATHDFLTPADIERIAARVPSAIASVQALAVAQQDDGRILGFCGVQEDSLEMLFVDPAHQDEGVGSALFRFATEKLGAQRLEVNQQNPQARRFYEHCGWSVTGWRETDDAGEPFPLLQMEPPIFPEEELREARRQIDSTLHKLRKTAETLSAKEHPERYKSQVTLAKRRIRALEIANTLIQRELDHLPPDRP